MKDKIKVFSKKYLIGFTLGLISGSLVMVYAETYFPSNQTTYDNSVSGMQATDVQGAIDELYNVCFPPTGSDTITDLLPSNPDELYEDEHGDIRYYGANPNNYVSFNNELWRIIGVIDGKIKIIRNESIGSMQWNSTRLNNWDNSSLKTYLNGTYYNSINEPYKGMISKETFYLGGPNSSNYRTLTASDYYDVERSNSVFSGNPVSTTQYIGLMYPSDFGYASGSGCLSTTIDGYTNGCGEDNYLSDEFIEWVQSPYASGVYITLVRNIGGTILVGNSVTNYQYVRPSLYLANKTVITGGDGSQNNPFQLG